MKITRAKRKPQHRLWCSPQYVWSSREERETREITRSREKVSYWHEKPYKRNSSTLLQGSRIINTQTYSAVVGKNNNGLINWCNWVAFVGKGGRWVRRSLTSELVPPTTWQQILEAAILEVAPERARRLCREKSVRELTYMYVYILEQSFYTHANNRWKTSKDGEANTQTRDQLMGSGSPLERTSIKKEVIKSCTV